VELRLLGPLQVLENGGVVEVGRGRESAVLALLAMNVNAALSTDRIVDELWAGNSPENATKSVQVYISRLRKALGNDRIETTAAGYLLRLSADELDVSRFERSANAGRARLESGDVAEAERTLSEALELWRGEALRDFRFESFAQAEIRRLDELRANTEADRADAQLALGRGEAAIPTLRALIAAQPLWERPRGQLMLALYRSGRQAEALEVYREARKLLDQELALAPSPELQELEHQILNHDPELGGVRRPRADQRRTRRAAWFVAVGGVLIAAGAATAIAVIATRGDTSRPLTSIMPNSLAAIDPSTDRLVAQVSLGSSPTAVGVGQKAVWVADAGRQQLLVVDPSRLQVSRTVPLAAIPADLAVGSRTVWATSPFRADSGALTRVDEQTGATQDVVIRHGVVSDLFAPSTPNAVALDESGDVWTDTVHERLVRIRGGQRQTYDLGRDHSIDGLAFGAGSLWIASSVDDTILRVDPNDGHVNRQIRIRGVGGTAAGPAAIVVGDDSIWVADALDNRVTRIDPRTESVVATIAVGARPTAVAVGAGGVWALNAGDGSVSHIDPATNRVVATIAVARIVTGLAVGLGRVWVAVAGGEAPESKPPPTPVRPLVTGSCAPMESGGRSPDLLIVSDFPSFDNASRSNPQIADVRAAISAVLRARGFRAGPFHIGYQACTDSSPATSPDLPLCAANARAFADDASVVGVIGAYQSSCTGVELPILNTSALGAVAMISPANTYVGLTHGGPQTGPDEPDRYFPTGVRNYVRLVSPDDGQGAALAELARQLHRRRLFLIDDGDPTGVAMVTYVARSARRLGLEVAGSGHWGPKGPYGPLASRIRAVHADAVVLTGCICSNAGELIVDLRHGLGPKVALLASDNFTCDCNMSGPDAPREGFGMYLTSAGATAIALPPSGRAFLRRVFPHRPSADLVVFVPIAAAATEALLEAIASSDGTRASVVGQLTHERVSNTPIGSISFDANGDPVRAPFTVFRVSSNAPATPHVPTGGLVVDRVIDADPGLAAP